jgi:hypothetical protein
LSTQQVKILFFLGLGSMASGERGLSIEEGDECSKCRRAQWQGAERGWQMKYGGELRGDGNAAHGSSASLMQMTKAFEQIFQ